MINQFDSYACLILNYASEIWGLTSAVRIDRVQRKFCKWMLNVKQSTNNLAVCIELGIYPLIIERKMRIVKYWLKLISNECNNIILNMVYRIMLDDASKCALNWLYKVKNLLESAGFAEIWMFPDSVIGNKCIPILRQRFMDIYIANWREGMNACSSLSLFKNVKYSYQQAPYIYKLIRNIEMQ